MLDKRRLLYDLLGELPPRERPVRAEVLGEVHRDAYTLEILLLDLNGMEPVPAYFTRPHGLQAPAPAVVYNHAHGGDYVRGKEEFLQGNAALQTPPYAEALARIGLCGLCIDAWNFGERRGRTESELFKELLWKGQVLWGLMIYDTLKATDYFITRPEVDSARIGTMGLSMGSTMAWWHAALDERVQACVDICCLTDFQALIETRGLDGHGLFYFVPALLKHFSTADINALICPRPHLSLAGNWDRLTPPAGLDRIDAAMKEVYAAAGVPERWELIRYNTGHFETYDMRARILRFLSRYLVGD
ncbi:MAG TPA: dienelactone hydrolase family protein [Chthonomonadaceae bacterium]|nr:dienelactone hydrolase family protein [Chthonomonadaceae bacterium]